MTTFRQKRTESLLPDNSDSSSSHSSAQQPVSHNLRALLAKLHENVAASLDNNASIQKHDDQQSHQSLVTSMQYYLLQKEAQDLLLRTRQSKEVNIGSPTSKQEPVDVSLIVAALRDKTINNKRTA